MVARINTVAFQGVDVIDVDVQVHLAPGLPAFTIAGSLYPHYDHHHGNYIDYPGNQSI